MKLVKKGKQTFKFQVAAYHSEDFLFCRKTFLFFLVISQMPGFYILVRVGVEFYLKLFILITQWSDNVAFNYLEPTHAVIKSEYWVFCLLSDTIPIGLVIIQY